MLLGLLHDFLLIFVPLLVVIDPGGAVPLFLSLTQRYPLNQRRAIARRATLVAAVVGVAFVVVGQALFALLGIRFADFQIAGGILLVVLAILDLLSPGKPAVDERILAEAGENPEADIGVVPLAVPLIVGPATMTTSLLLVSTFGKKYAALLGDTRGEILVVCLVCLALVLNLLILFAAMSHAHKLERIFGRQVMLVVNKIVMILLAAIAVSLIRQGVLSVLAEARTPQ